MYLQKKSTSQRLAFEFLNATLCILHIFSVFSVIDFEYGRQAQGH